MRQFAVLVVAVGACVGFGGPVCGQELPAPFERLGTVVRPGETITVLDAAGTKTSGRVGLLTPGTLTLTSPAGVRQLKERDILEIRQRRGDSLVNGAIVGAVSAAAYYAVMGAIFADMDGGDVQVGPAIAGGVIFAGVGAAAGAGIDALIRRQQVIYRRPGAARVSLSPLAGGRRGAALTVRF
ncbi:MAG TPA: hypothetical protein VF147_11130 [Vicinamibacterales bacterium]